MYQVIKVFLYYFIRVFVLMGVSFSYRKIYTAGYHKVKNKLPALFVSNHQNTFMDGLILTKSAYKNRPHILVRADIFKSKLAALALDLIHLIPIYRKRDGMGSVAQNNDIFKKCIDLFGNKQSILIFPEGNHAIQRFLRPLQKGAARLAFQAEEAYDFQLGLQLMPMGLHYENHPNRWYDLHVYYGDPILAKDYEKLYREQPQQAINELTALINEKISQEMIDIKWHDEYETMEDFRLLLKPYAISFAENKKSQIHAENELIQTLSQYFQADETTFSVFKTNLSTFYASVKDAGMTKDFKAVRPNIIQLIFKFIGLISGFPFWLLAKIGNLIPEYLIERKVIASVKDITWHISLRAGISSFLYPLYYGLLWLIFGLIFDSIIGAIICFSMPIFSVIQYEWAYQFRHFRNDLILFRNTEILNQEKGIVVALKLFMNEESIKKNI